MNIFIKVYNYFLGTLKLEISGEFSERLLNILAAENIKFWGIEKSNESFIIYCYKKDILRIKKLRRKAFVSVKIICKKGFPVLFRKYKHRYGILSVIFSVLLIIFSKFIWVININGNNSIENREIVECLNSLNIKEGCKVSSINTDYLKQKLILSCDNISWASLNVEGCVLNVNILEFENSLTNDNPPCNLIADNDGIIVKMNIHSGNYMVTVGQTVSKGQLLVSGVNTEKGINSFIYSSGEVFASVPETLTLKVEKTVNYKNYTGKSNTKYARKVFNTTVPLYLGKDYGEYKRTNEIIDLKLFSEKIPIRVYKSRADFYNNKEKVLSETEAYDIALNDLQTKLDAEKAIDYRIIDTFSNENENEYVFVFRIRKTIDIAKKDFFKINSEN